MKTTIRREMIMPAGVSAQLRGASLKVKGPKGEAERVFLHPKLNLSLEGNKIVLEAPKGTKREKKMVGSFSSHIKNIIKGVQEPHFYKLKVCSGHFPMNVSVSGQEFVIKNFLGESVPRKVLLPKGVEVKVSGTDITVSGADKELAGQAAAKIESLCRITNRDIRIFQDGCHITHKAGKDVA